MITLWATTEGADLLTERSQNSGGAGRGPIPIGSAGLVRFDRALRPVWQLDIPDMADCYALDVDRDTDWTYYYTEFPIARIAAGTTTIWNNPESSSGAKALAVAEDRVALYGGYGDDGKRLALGRLDDDRFHLQLVDELGFPRRHQQRLSRLHGRGDTLHPVVDQHWYRAHPLG